MQCRAWSRLCGGQGSVPLLTRQHPRGVLVVGPASGAVRPVARAFAPMRSGLLDKVLKLSPKKTKRDEKHGFFNRKEIFGTQKIASAGVCRPAHKGESLGRRNR